MQTIPAPVYFIPMLLFFGVRRVPAAIATVIYALPPAVRLTTLGIAKCDAGGGGVRDVRLHARQTLFKVQCPWRCPRS